MLPTYFPGQHQNGNMGVLKARANLIRDRHVGRIIVEQNC